MIKPNDLVRWIGIGLTGATIATGSLAQHPTLGPGYPALDPRHVANLGAQVSASRTVESTYWLGVEGCAFRAQGLRSAGKPYTIDVWALGVEKWDDRTMLYFELRTIDRSGTALAVERPTLYMFPSGPTYDWQPARSPHQDFVRVERNLADASARELLGFATSITERGLKQLAITLPDGRGDAYFGLFDGATPRQFNIFANCVCDLLGEGNPLLQCR